MNSVTQGMAYRQSLMKYAEKYGVGRACREYNKGRSLSLLLESPLGRNGRVLGLPISPPPQSPQSAHAG